MQRRQQMSRRRRAPRVSRRVAFYERLKAQWTNAHPGATSTEYEAAMRMLAQQAGV